MKKNFMYAILCAAVLLTGCAGDGGDVTQGSETAAATSETTAVTTAAERVTTTAISTTVTTETTTEETTVTEWEYMDRERILSGFLSYLQHGGYVEGEINYFAFDQGNDFWNYDFMDDFKIDSYSYEHRGGGVFDVTLTCSESICELFPNGDSYWVFDYYFIPAERENKILFPIDMLDVTDPLKTAYFAAVDFSLATRTFEADEEWFENYTDINVHEFYHAYNPYFTVFDYEKREGYNVTIEEFAAAVKKLYNINMTAEQAQSMTDETGFMIKVCGHGGYWLYDDFAGYDETEDEIKVRVDYCGDEMYLYPVVQSEYTFSKNGDGTISLQRVEKTFDKGYEPARGSI